MDTRDTDGSQMTMSKSLVVEFDTSHVYLSIFNLTLTITIKLTIMKDIKSKIWKACGPDKENYPWFFECIN